MLQHNYILYIHNYNYMLQHTSYCTMHRYVLIDDHGETINYYYIFGQKTCMQHQFKD